MRNYLLAMKKFRLRALRSCSLISDLSFKSFPVFLLIVLVLAACSQKASHPVNYSEFQASRLQVRNLINEIGVLRSKELDSYLNYLTTRLLLNAPAGERNQSFQVLILNTTSLLAYSPGDGQVVISRGMIGTTRNEAELAFVLAHEMSHQLLGHTSSPELSHQELYTNPELQKLELAADRHAIGLIGLAGYDPRSGVQAIPHIYRTAGLLSGGPTHPALDERITAVADQIRESRWSPPGTVDRREFRKFRQVVIAVG